MSATIELSVTVAPKPLCVGTKRGTNYGLVYDAEGVVIGRVFRHARVAAGTKGQRRPFWTAYVQVDGVEGGHSLGTRHHSRASAVAAVRAFSRSYPPEYLRASARSMPAQPWLYHGTTSWGTALYRALIEASGTFKLEHPAVCALPYAPKRAML